MKKSFALITLVCAIAAAFVFVACEGDDGNKADARDAFVGTYNYVATGSVAAYYDGNMIMNYPLDSKGRLDILKVGSGDEVMIDGLREMDRAIVLGDQLIMEGPMVITTRYGNNLRKFSYSDAYGTMNGDTLNIVMNVDVVREYDSMDGHYTAYGSDKLYVIAVK